MEKKTRNLLSDEVFPKLRTLSGEAAEQRYNAVKALRDAGRDREADRVEANAIEAASNLAIYGEDLG